MVFDTTKHKEAVQIACEAKLLGRRTRLSRDREQLAQMASDNYRVTVLHLLDEEVEHGPARGRPRLRLIVDSLAEGRAGWREQTVGDLAVMAAYLNVLRTEASINIHEHAVVALTDLQGICLTRILSHPSVDRRRLIERHLKSSGFFDVDSYRWGTAVFLVSDEQVQVARTDGAWERLKRSWHDAHKPFDQLGYFTMDTLGLSLSSKETIDREYGGQTFNWFR